MVNNVESISLEIGKIMSDLSHGGVLNISEMEVIDIITDKLIDILKDDLDTANIKKALRNMFVAGQLNN